MTPKTIGIMSMHRIFNYGSFLQGYALKNLLHTLSPDSVIRFLDYRPGPTLVKSSEGKPHGLARIAQKIAEYSRVDASPVDKIRFFNHKRNYAKRNFSVLGLDPEPNYDYQVDLQVIGSDEVFNCVQANANVGYSRDLFGNGSPAKRLISYAASFGNTTIEKLKRYQILDPLAEDLSRFDDISVRDENSFSIVHELTGKTASINVDPVLAYDYMQDCKHIPSRRILDYPYMIVYGYSGRFTRDEDDCIRAYARSKGLKVICVGGVQGCCDRFLDCSPFEVLALFRDAECIVTDTFHGTIFSIINEKPFATIIRRSHGEAYGNEEKLHYLLRYLRLEQQGIFDLPKGKLHELLSSEPDYASTRDIIGTARASARSYLQRNVTAERVLA
jgi:Polysaccharide pyruvyl transferase.